jgi:hypothetical protein
MIMEASMRSRHFAQRFAFLAILVLFSTPSLAATGCFGFPSQTEIPELNAAKLGNGNHVVAETMTSRGLLRVHVKVRGRTISNPIFEINGKRMKKTAMRHVPKDIRTCLEESKKSAESSERRQIAFTGPIQQLRMYSPRTDVRFTGRCTVKASCNQNVCCALATCGREQAVECVGF